MPTNGGTSRGRQKNVKSQDAPSRSAPVNTQLPLPQFRTPELSTVSLTDEMPAPLSEDQTNYLPTIVNSAELWHNYNESCEVKTMHLLRSPVNKDKYLPNIQCETLFSEIVGKLRMPPMVSLSLRD